ncbi:hypothetical protein [Acidithiobacillus ferrivorans]|uniref:hypothetical protein n=1 Tax=Acidithiobacillus ferrivorans TaxID=160808 RepID=UPI003AA95141
MSFEVEPKLAALTIRLPAPLLETLKRKAQAKVFRTRAMCGDCWKRTWRSKAPTIKGCPVPKAPARTMRAAVRRADDTCVLVICTAYILPYTGICRMLGGEVCLLLPDSI